MGHVQGGGAPRGRRRRLFLGVSLAAASTAFGGCCVIPLPYLGNEVTEGRRVADEDFLHIVPGETTRSRVVELLGRPTAIWEDASIDIYSWATPRMLYVVLAPGHATAGGIGAGAVMRRRALLVQYGHDGRVARRETVVLPLDRTCGETLRAWAVGAPPAVPRPELVE